MLFSWQGTFIIITIVILVFITTSIEATAEPQKYNFQIWTNPSELSNDINARVYGNFCPSPFSIDNSSSKQTHTIFITIIATRPDGSIETAGSSYNGTNACNSVYLNVVGGDGMNGIWSVVSNATWTAGNITHYVTSNVANFLAEEPHFRVANVTKIYNISGIHSSESDVRWDSNGNLVFQNDGDWHSIKPDGSNLRSLTTTEIQNLNLQKNPRQFGNMFVKYVNGDSHEALGATIFLGSINGSYKQTIYSLQYANIWNPSISPDGKYFAYLRDGFDHSQDGLWVIQLAEPVPEFPLAQVILVISIMSAILFYRIRFRK